MQISARGAKHSPHQMRYVRDQRAGGRGVMWMETPRLWTAHAQGVSWKLQMIVFQTEWTKTRQSPWTLRGQSLKTEHWWFSLWGMSQKTCDLRGFSLMLYLKNSSMVVFKAEFGSGGRGVGSRRLDMGYARDQRSGGRSAMWTEMPLFFCRHPSPPKLLLENDNWSFFR